MGHRRCLSRGPPLATTPPCHAYPRLHPALPARSRRPAPCRPRLDSRDKARRLSPDGAPELGIRLFTRNGHDWAPRYPAIVEAVNALRARSCLIDGEAVCCDANGLAVFERLRYRRDDRSVFLFAFDLLELDGEDLRREPLETRKATLASLLRGGPPGLRLNEHLSHPGDVVFRHACKMGLEGIVSKRLGSRYRSGRSPDWLKFKNPEAPAAKRETEEDWS